MHSLGVVAARGIEVAPLAGEVLMVLEVGHSLVEAPTFKAVADGNEFFVLLLDFSDNGMPVSFELGTSLVVALVALHFGRGGEVQRMDCCSQCEEWSPCWLEELLAPVGHGVEVALWVIYGEVEGDYIFCFICIFPCPHNDFSAPQHLDPLGHHTPSLLRGDEGVNAPVVELIVVWHVNVTCLSVELSYFFVAWVESSCQVVDTVVSFCELLGGNGDALFDCGGEAEGHCLSDFTELSLAEVHDGLCWSERQRGVVDAVRDIKCYKF
jgi:hypothetical protein